MVIIAPGCDVCVLPLTRTYGCRYQKLLEVKAELSGESERDIQRQMAEIRDKNAAELAELRSQARLVSIPCVRDHHDGGGSVDRDKTRIWRG